MGNKPDRSRKTQQPYNQMVEDAITALEDRPGSTQADIFNYLEAKYEGKISPKNKHNLQTVIRSVIQSKKRLRTGSGGIRRPGYPRGRPGRLRVKAGRSSKPGGGRGRRVRGVMGRPPGKGFKSKLVLPKTPKTLKFGWRKKLAIPQRSTEGAAGHRLLRRVKRGGRRGGKLFLRPARRTTSEGSLSLPPMNDRMRRN